MPLDLYRRKIVGREVHDSDASNHAIHLVKRTALVEVIAMPTTKPVPDGDNVATLKATTVILNWLGVDPSYSRPLASDENVASESLFRTSEYLLEFAVNSFADVDAARACAVYRMRWYNYNHRHSAIRHVGPAQRRAGKDHAILAARQKLYARARKLNPASVHGKTRN